MPASGWSFDCLPTSGLLRAFQPVVNVFFIPVLHFHRLKSMPLLMKGLTMPNLDLIYPWCPDCQLFKYCYVSDNIFFVDEECHVGVAGTVWSRMVIAGINNSVNYLLVEESHG